MTAISLMALLASASAIAQKDTSLAPDQARVREIAAMLEDKPGTFGAPIDAGLGRDRSEQGITSVEYRTLDAEVENSMVKLVLTGIAFAVAAGAHAAQPNWFIYRNAPGAEIAVVTDPLTGVEAVRFQYCRTETHYAVIVANQKPPIRATAQQKLVFWLRGEPANGDASLGVALSVPSQ